VSREGAPFSSARDRPYKGPRVWEDGLESGQVQSWIRWMTGVAQRTDVAGFAFVAA
jgi:hypothetical protein